MPPSGVTIAVDAREIAQIGRALRQTARASLGPLTAGLAAVGESATRARLSQGGPGPAGEPWDTRHPADPSAKPLLTREGGLVDSLVSTARRHQATWGSNLVYARIHQLGGTIRPRRAKALHFRLGDTPVFGGLYIKVDRSQPLYIIPIQRRISISATTPVSHRFVPCPLTN